jgi:predicted flap endonuclease-1-like 5' DNA nuclease
MSFRNLQHPLSWDAIFKYIGFPAYMKPHAGGGWKHVYKINSPEDFFQKYAETGQLVMMLQSEVQFDEYFRCYCLGGNRVHIMQYDPRNPHEARYVKDGAPVSKELLAKVEDYTLKLNRALGYDFNTVEFGVQNGIPYAIDFCNPAPDADLDSVGKDNFEWVVENAAMMAIERARIHREGQNNLTWGTFVKNAIAGYAPNMPNPVWGGATREVREVSDVQRTTVNPISSSTAQPIMPSSPLSMATRTSTISSTTTRTVTQPTETVSQVTTTVVQPKETIVASTKDDLKKIEGIGPKIEELLNAAGIMTFVQLSITSQQKLQEVLDAAGKRFAMHDPTSWTLQANLASKGDWESLKQLQAQLIGGKSK